VVAVGAFTPKMVEWAPDICRRIADVGRMVVDTRDADHEAGDLLQAGIEVSALPTLANVVAGSPDQKREPGRQADAASDAAGIVFFKSCGWAGWDLAAAHCCLKFNGSNTRRGIRGSLAAP
jgi:1-piperideine-2-carboxylate/1-pyrroline-2-carboxylate reductase [NAD(P)H]